MTKNNDTTRANEKEEPQNPLKSMIQGMERDLELNQNFFLDDNVDDQKIIILKKTVKKNSD